MPARIPTGIKVESRPDKDGLAAVGDVLARRSMVCPMSAMLAMLLN